MTIAMVLEMRKEVSQEGGGVDVEDEEEEMNLARVLGPVLNSATGKALIHVMC